MPDPAVISDDGEIVIQFGEVHLRMTYAQFDKLIDKADAWRKTVPAEDTVDLDGEW